MSFRNRAIITIKYLIEGLIIGASSVLPGVSAGILGVMFGLYRPMMNFFSSPRASLKKYYRMYIPVCIGMIAGFILVANLLSVLFRRYEVVSTWLFIGLIVGSMPELVKTAKKRGTHKNDKIILIITFFVFIAGMLCIMLLIEGEAVRPSIPAFLLCGLLWGLSIIIPGVSSASVLMGLGLYIPLTAGIGHLSPAVLLPWAAGIVVTVLAGARGVSYLFEKHYSATYYAVIGIVSASTLVIIPTEYRSVLHVILCLLAGAIGFVCALLFSRLSAKISETEETS